MPTEPEAVPSRPMETEANCEECDALKARYQVTLRAYTKAHELAWPSAARGRVCTCLRIGRADTAELRRRAKGLSKSSPSAPRIISSR
jgi:hypothetical protein